MNAFYTPFSVNSSIQENLAGKMETIPAIDIYIFFTVIKSYMRPKISSPVMWSTKVVQPTLHKTAGIILINGAKVFGLFF